MREVKKVKRKNIADIESVVRLMNFKYMMENTPEWGERYIKRIIEIEAIDNSIQKYNN